MAALMVLFCKVMKSVKFEGQNYLNINFMLIIAAVYTCFLHTRTVISFLLVKNHDLKELRDVRAIHVVWWPCMSAGHTCGLVAICIYWPYTCHSKPVLFVTFRCSLSLPHPPENLSFATVSPLTM